jgi:hypothetical protein
MAKEVSLENLGRTIKEEVEVLSSLEYKAICFDVFGEVLKFTPVDTGRARNNWHIGIVPDYSESKQPDYSLRITTGELPTVYITNGLSYIETLEDGRSKQSPNGITGPALAAVRSRR